MKSPRGGERQIATFAASVVAVIAYAAQVLLGIKMPGWLQCVIAGTGAMATFIAIWLPSRAATSARAIAVMSASAQRQELQDLLAPVISLLVQITAEKNVTRRRKYQFPLGVSDSRTQGDLKLET